MSSRRALAVIAAVSLVGCTAPEPSSGPREVAQALPAPQAPLPDGLEVVSNADTYRIVYRTTPADVPRGELFDLVVWAFDAEGRPLPPDHTVRVDAGMPQHRHGMNVVPRTTRREDRGFDVEGLLFHMPGAWTLTFDVEVGGITERAQTIVEL